MIYEIKSTKYRSEGKREREGDVKLRVILIKLPVIDTLLIK